jgi:hypothetical protein
MTDRWAVEKLVEIETIDRRAAVEAEAGGERLDASKVAPPRIGSPRITQRASTVKCGPRTAFAAEPALTFSAPTSA